MKEMGFNKEASDSVKEAFIKYLIKQTTGYSVQTLTEKNEIKKSQNKVVELPIQTSFSFLEEDQSPAQKPKKQA